MYRSLSTNVHHFIKDIDYYLQVKEQDQLHVFIGEININLFEEDYITNKLCSTLVTHGFACGIKNPTRVTNTTATCLDHLFIKNKTKIL